MVSSRWVTAFGGHASVGRPLLSLRIRAGPRREPFGPICIGGNTSGNVKARVVGVVGAPLLWQSAEAPCSRGLDERFASVFVAGNNAPLIDERRIAPALVVHASGDLYIRE